MDDVNYPFLRREPDAGTQKPNPWAWAALAAAGAFLLIMIGLGAGGKRTLVAKAERAVTAGLFDPGSARFEKETVRKGDGVVCGFVNTKDKFGGYVGFRRFFYNENIGSIIQQNDGDAIIYGSYFSRC
jgi:hypothetical protein